MSNVHPLGGMAIDPRLRAVRNQALASDPAVSAFVEASAGSGKTKLLTDRILRLMLGGAAPGRIQCLTFTKAAAAEMALRLQHRLGVWVTLDDEPLDGELAALEMAPTEGLRDAARRLFAEVLDLPGGMRIGTIHAFCQGLLRRFPLEAAISPHFQLVEETEAAAEMQAAREDVLAAADPATVGLVAGLVRAEMFSDLVQALQGARIRLAPLMSLTEAGREAAVWRAAGVSARTDAEAVAHGVAWGEESVLHEALWRAQEQGSATVRERALTMLGWLSLPAAERVVRWDDWLDQFYTGEGKLRAFGLFPDKKLHGAHPTIREAVEAEQARVVAVEDVRRGVRCAEATCALLRLAAPALDAYEATKARGGLLDYTDLIGRTERLLEDPGAAWVLYKLDGGIDHLLLDEVQDTAPEQWRIAHRLTEEFFAGIGTQDPQAPGGVRTFFAVGDPKQSIYSFQGADPAEFTRSRERMTRRVTGSGQRWRDVTLDVSFRSTAPVLSLVDTVFRDALAADGVVADGGVLEHLAHRAGAAGRVELWPLAMAPPIEKPGDWTVPAENMGLVSAPQLLADGLAGAVAAMLARGERLESRGRALQAGDILVLVRRRGAFATALVRALKARGVAVAGLDRLQLTEQVAVQDLLAACDAVLLPEDCLTVACVLTSPLGGLTDDSLMALAMGRTLDGRTRRLWDTLRERAGERADWEAAWRFLSSVAARVDYVSPHALLVEMLGVLGGRARLLGRLGAEAAEPIDELLGAALEYGRVHPPSLQGFVHWLRRSGAEVKREAGGAGSAVRVMTAHGAKGLQAPMVILPDTTGLPPEDKTRLAWWAGEMEVSLWVPLWAPRKELAGRAWRETEARARALRMREYNRLLYVALTRAEDRLLVCGWQGRGEPAPESWYAAVRRGFEALGAVGQVREEAFEAAGWGGTVLVMEQGQTEAVTRPKAGEAGAAVPLPVWAGRPGDWRAQTLPLEPALPRPLAPSRPTGSAFGPVPAAASPLGAGGFARGNAVHALLQHLPSVPEAGREAAGAAFLARAAVADDERGPLLHQVLAVLAHPALSALFGPGSRAEQPLSALVDGAVVSGVVDRMVVLPDRVVVADFKTGRAAPARAEAVPVRYLRQLAAYRAVLRALFPGRTVACVLVWTEGAVVMEVDGALLDRNWQAG